MLNQASYDRDTVIDVILPAAPGDNLEALRQALSQAVCAAKPARASILEDFFAENAALRAELQNAGMEAGVGVTALKCPSLHTAVAVLAKLKNPGAITAPDGSAVDLLCVLFYPERESVQYLRRLSRLTRLFRNAELCAKIRDTQDEETIRSLIHSPEGWMLAA